jgi:hypothetical protein
LEASDMKRQTVRKPAEASGQRRKYRKPAVLVKRKIDVVVGGCAGKSEAYGCSSDLNS